MHAYHISITVSVIAEDHIRLLRGPLHPILVYKLFPGVELEQVQPPGRLHPSLQRLITVAVNWEAGKVARPTINWLSTQSPV